MLSIPLEVSFSGWLRDGGLSKRREVLSEASRRRGRAAFVSFRAFPLNEKENTSLHLVRKDNTVVSDKSQESVPGTTGSKTRLCGSVIEPAFVK
jgi:hypothetical protein